MLPPTNATAASEYTDASSPIVSSSTICPGRVPELRRARPPSTPTAGTHANPDPSSRPATAPNRSGCRGLPSPLPNCGSSSSNGGHASSSAASSPSSVLPATTSRTGARAQQSSDLRLRRHPHIEFQIAGDRDRSARQPSARSRSASSLALRQYPSQPAENRPPQTAQHLVARPRPIRDPRVHHRHRNPATEASDATGSARTPSPPEPATPAAAHSDISAPPTADPADNRTLAPLRTARAPAPDPSASSWKSTPDAPAMSSPISATSRLTASTSPTETACSQITGLSSSPRALSTAPAPARAARTVLRDTSPSSHPPQPPRSSTRQNGQQRQVIEKKTWAWARRIAPFHGLTLK